MFQSLEIYLLDDDPVFLQTFSQALEDYLRQQSCIFQIHAFTDGKELLARASERRQADLPDCGYCLGLFMKQMDWTWPQRCAAVFLGVVLSI